MSWKIPTLAFLLTVSSAFAVNDKPHVKDMKPLDAKAMEQQVKADQDFVSNLDPQVFDSRGFDITVENIKGAAVALEIKWLVTVVDDEGNRTEHQWVKRQRETLSPDSHGAATMRTHVIHFAKDLKTAAARGEKVWIFEGWAVYVIGADNKTASYKTSSSAVEKIVKDDWAKNKPGE